jgi:hypothetical protein
MLLIRCPRRGSFVVGLVLGVALPVGVLAAVDTRYTTSPSYTVTLSGKNTEGDDAQWTDVFT